MLGLKKVSVFMLVVILLWDLCLPVNAFASNTPTLTLPDYPQLELKDLDPSPPSPPSNISVKNISSDSVDLTWSYTGTVKGFNVYYSSQRDKNGFPLSPKKLTTTSNSIKISNLHQATVYYVVVKAFNTQGESKPSPVKSFKTKSTTANPQLQILKEQLTIPKLETKPEPPKNLSASDVTTESVQLTWEHTGSPKGFNVYYSNQKGPNGYPLNPKKIDITSKSTTIQNLQSETTYYFMVKAFNNAGESSPSNILSVKTKSTAILKPVLPDPKEDLIIKQPVDLKPLPPSNLRAEEINSSAFELTWQHQGEAEGYNVYYSTELNKNRLPALPKKINCKTTSVTISNLKASTTYYVMVTAYNSSKESVPSKLLEVKTEGLINKPMLPEKITISNYFSNIFDTKIDEQKIKLPKMQNEVENEIKTHVSEVIFKDIKPPRDQDTNLNVQNLQQGIIDVRQSIIETESEDFINYNLPEIKKDLQFVASDLAETLTSDKEEQGTLTLPEERLTLEFDYEILPPPNELSPDETSQEDPHQDVFEGPQLLAAVAQDYEDGMDVVFFVFDSVTNRPELPTENLSEVFNIREGSWGSCQKQIVWIPKENDDYGDILAVIFPEQDGVNMTVEETVFTISPNCGIYDPSTQSTASGGPITLTGDFGPEEESSTEENLGPQMLGAYAYDLQEQGDAVLIAFDRITNRPEITPGELDEFFLVSNGSWGEASLEIYWIPPEDDEQRDILAVIFPPQVAVDLTVGETQISITRDSGITDNKGNPAVETTVLLQGDFGPQQERENETGAPQLTAVYAYDLEDQGDAVLFMFDRVTNRPEIDSSNIEECFPLTNGNWGEGPYDIFWIPPESEGEGDTLAVVFYLQSGVEMTVGDTEIGILEDCGIADPSGTTPVMESSTVLQGDFGPVTDIQRTAPRLLKAIAYDLQEQGDAVLLVFNQVTNRPEIDSSNLEDWFSISSGSWEPEEKEIFWVPPEGSQAGDTLAIVYPPQSVVDMTVGQTEISISQSCEIFDETGTAAATQESVLLEGDFGPETGTATQNQTSFTDVSNHWGREYIEELVSYGITNGYPDNTFRPNNKLSRGEFYTFIVRTLYAAQLALSGEIPEGPMQPYVVDPRPTPYFEDTGNHWSSGYIDIAKNGQIILPEEYSSRRFQPNTNINRLEIATAVVRAMGLQDYVENFSESELPFTDSNQIPENRKGHINIAITLGIITGYDTGEFKPQGEATRAEAAAMLTRMFNKLLNSQ